MSLILKGVFDITYSIVNAVVHVLLRDLTNYYWHLEDDQQHSEAEVGGLISSLNEVNLNRTAPTKPEESVAFLSTGELPAENIPNDSFCTTLDIEESIPNVMSESNGIEELVIGQDYDVANQQDIPNFIDEFISLESLEQQLSKNIEFTFNDIMSQNEDSFNCLSSPKKENIWVEVENFNQTIDNINFDKDYLNVAEKELSKNSMENLVIEIGTSNNTRTEYFEIGSEIEENLPSQLENTSLSVSIETGGVDTNENETEQPLPLKGSGTFLQDKANFIPHEFVEIHSTDDNIPEETIMSNHVQSIENISIGDRKKSETELQTDGKSDISSECELGIRNFQIQNLIDECSKVGKSEATEQKTKKKKKQIKSKISRYVGKTMNKPAEPKLQLEEDERVNLQPVTYDEITNTQSLLTDLDRTKSDNNIEPSKFTEIRDELPEISNVPPEVSDLGSVCSDESWDSWLGKFVTIMRSKSPARDASFTVKSEVPKEEDLCDCINSHRCLLVVDSDEEVTEDLLTTEQLGSVETGSVSDWLYRVNPRSPLLSYTLKTNKPDPSTPVEHYSDSSEEDVAKKFYTKQWLDKNIPHQTTETYYTDITSKFIGSGDVM